MQSHDGSHWHWDHIGDPSRFPTETELIVGPGFKDEFLPGYPAKADAPVRESDFAYDLHTPLLTARAIQLTHYTIQGTYCAGGRLQSCRPGWPVSCY